jgi:hypothetical protein
MLAIFVETFFGFFETSGSTGAFRRSIEKRRQGEQK